MKYLLLVYGDERQRDAMSASERAVFEDCRLANEEALRESGHLLAAEGLHSSQTATTVRVHGGKVSISDGPFAQMKEQLLGLYFINARDLNEAIQVASNLPQARTGPIEVRPRKTE